MNILVVVLFRLVNRRIGGLENYMVLMHIELSVNRRIGGLETTNNNQTSPGQS